MKIRDPNPDAEFDQTIAELVRSTAKIRFSEIQRFFAQGILYVVDVQSDLIEVAKLMVRDDQAAMANLINEHKFARVEDHIARAWIAADTELWCVVVAPYVLVQELGSSEELQ